MDLFLLLVKWLYLYYTFFTKKVKNLLTDTSFYATITI